MLTNVIAEENHKDLKVFSINTIVVNNKMQKKIKISSADLFHIRNKFIEYYNNN
tara:strand:+ start:1191 stop:1352 length:162 start_codon:yes stop_codon:yes gene_type:complete